MPSKETVKKREELRQMFHEIYQIAWIGASPILREALEKYKKRFEELTQKNTGKNGATSRSGGMNIANVKLTDDDHER